jgi:hypothetical protein
VGRVRLVGPVGDPYQAYPPYQAYLPNWADVAQLAERVLGKDEVTSSILVIGSNLRS